MAWKQTGVNPDGTPKYEYDSSVPLSGSSNTAGITSSSGLAGWFSDKFAKAPTQVGNYGGAGTYGWIKDPTNGDRISLDKNAFEAAKPSGMDMGTYGDIGIGDAAGMLGGVVQLGQLGLGLANYGLQKDQFAFNKMNANRNYEAEKTKYNNAVDRTAAINDFYGSKNTATRIG